MGEIVDLSIARDRRAPSTARIARPTTRDQLDLTAKFTDFTPSKLGAIIRETERGVIQNWADLCDRMAVDGTVKAAYESRLAAVSASRWIVEPGDSTGDRERDRYSEDARAFVERVYRDIDRFEPPSSYRQRGDFNQATSDLLDGIGKGLSVCEIDWRYLVGSWVPARLEWIHTRRFRFSKTWEPLLVDTGDQLHTSGIPLEPGKFIVHMPRPIAGYPTMTGAMRTVVWPYLFKKWGQQYWLSGAERFAWPFMWAKVPRGAPKEVRADALEGIEKLSADHAAVLEDPAAVELLESSVKDGGTWKEFHAAMNGEISKGIQGMADAAEATKIGAYGAVEARAGIAVDPRIAIDEAGIAETQRRDLTFWLLWFNRHLFGGAMPPVPHVRRVVAGTKREIRPEAYRAVSRNEVREKLDLHPLDGPEGDEPMDGAGLSDAEAATLNTILAAVEAGSRSSKTAALQIAISIPSISATRARELADAAAEARAGKPETEEI